MKNKLVKQIGAGLMIGLLLVTTISVRSASVTLNQPGAQTNSMATGPGNITQISLTATAGVAYVVSIYDAPALSLTNILAGYTNYAATLRTNTVTYTDILGNTVSNSYYYITNLPTSLTPSNVITYRLIGTYAAPANSSIVIPFTTANPFFFGIFATNNVGGSMSVNYQPYK